MIILSLRVDKPKNKIDHRGKETCANENDHISLLRYSTMSSARNFCFYIFYYNPMEKDHIRRKINSKKKNIYM